MKVYEMTGDLDYYRGLTSEGTFDDEVFDGRSLKEKWKPIELKQFYYRKKMVIYAGFCLVFR